MVSATAVPDRAVLACAETAEEYGPNDKKSVQLFGFAGRNPRRSHTALPLRVFFFRDWPMRSPRSPHSLQPDGTGTGSCFGPGQGDCPLLSVNASSLPRTKKRACKDSFGGTVRTVSRFTALRQSIRTSLASQPFASAFSAHSAICPLYFSDLILV
jgi:hypothetical protein